MDLFDVLAEKNENSRPLAERMRPQKLDDFIGQEHIVGQNSLLRRAIKADKLGSVIFYGGPGSGKTSLANIISKMTESPCVMLNAVLSGVSDAKKVIEDSNFTFKTTGKKTFLILDECHRWSKAQSDCLLSPIEKGTIIFVGTTTENPYANLTRALISRCRVFEFKKVTSNHIFLALKRVITDDVVLKNYSLTCSDEALKHISLFSDGDLRCAYNDLELAVLTTNPNSKGEILIDLEAATQSIQKKALSLDEDTYYDMLSAFCKSLRGSDSDAALYWSERMIQGGIDPLIILRRLVVHSSEDVGMADPNALNIAISAYTAMEKLGLPEGRIPLAEAIIYVCETHKSNSVVVALGEANKFATEHKDDIVPPHLVSVSYKMEKDVGYKYVHDYGGWCEQQYLPTSIKDAKFYIPKQNGFEASIVRRKK